MERYGKIRVTLFFSCPESSELICHKINVDTNCLGDYVCFQVINVVFSVLQVITAQEGLCLQCPQMV